MGAIAVMTGLAFALYLVIPDMGFGGSVVKMRFAWAVFIFGGLLICSVERLRRYQLAIQLFVGVLLVGQLVLIASQVRATSDAAAQYLAAMDKLPMGAHFVRVHYSAPAEAERFRLNRLSALPMLHLAALGAVRRHALDLSDYQSASGAFSAMLKPVVEEGKRASLWALESPEPGTWAGLEWVRKDTPLGIDYAVIFSDDIPPEVEAHGTLVGHLRKRRVRAHLPAGTGENITFIQAAYCQPPPSARYKFTTALSSSRRSFARSSCPVNKLRCASRTCR